MAVDVNGDVAVTVFARRGVGCVWQEIHVLALRNGTWQCLGGGGGSWDNDDELLADRPDELPMPPIRPDGAVVKADPRVLAVDGGGGGVHDTLGKADRWPWSGRWVSHAEVRVNARVMTIGTGGRLVPVPWHGRVAVVWPGRGDCRVVALDGRGESLGEAVLRSPR